MRPGTVQGVGDGCRVAVGFGVATAVVGASVLLKIGVMVEGRTAVGKDSVVEQPSKLPMSKINKRTSVRPVVNDGRVNYSSRIPAMETREWLSSSAGQWS